MKKLLLIMLALAAISVGSVKADLGNNTSIQPDTSWRELFKVTEGKVLDIAILSSVEGGFYRDLINGQSLTGAQTPFVYITPYITGDFGYVTGYDNKSQGALMIGGSIRINKLIEDAFKGKVSVVRDNVPVIDKYWDRLWFGPWISKRFSDFDSTLLGGIKAGLSW